MARILGFLIVFLLPVHSAFGSPLEKRLYEFNVDFVYGDTDDVGAITVLDGSLLYVLDRGFIEPGFFLSYFMDDPDLGSSFDGYAIGPRLDLNLTPDLNYTPYFTVSAGFIGGDNGDLFDFLYSFGVGLKTFINDWAAFTVTLGRETLNGESNIDDLDTTFLTAGFSLFGGNK